MIILDNGSEIMEEWNNFKGIKWQQGIDVEDFIINNYEEYTGSSEFLKGISKRTNRLLSRCEKLFEKEDISKIYDVETNYFSGIDNFDPGYIDKKSELIVGLQTDELLKMFVNPNIAFDKSISTMKDFGYRMDRDMVERFEEFNTSLDEAIDDVYTMVIKKLKEVHMLDGMPDDYGRGFMMGDYRRLPLYGADYLIARKYHDLNRLKKDINYSVVRTREEVVKQIKALQDMKSMAKRYDIDISRPAKDSKEAIQFLYIAYLSASKETGSCSLPVGNNSAFLDIYIERDIKNGIYKEEEIQEFIDQFILKLRTIRFLNTKDYHKIFIGKNPIITETIGGIYNGKSLITKTAFRFLNSIDNLGSYPAPCFNILWSSKLPFNFKRYCSKVMMKSNSLQFINGDMLNGFEYASTGCASVSKIGKQIDYNGSAINLPKCLLYAINGGVDEITGEVVIPGINKIEGDKLDYLPVIHNFTLVLGKVIEQYTNALNIIHYMHDKYLYESSIMAFNDTVVERYMTLGMVGLPCLVDSLCAIKFTDVKINRDEAGNAIDYVVEGKFPRFGNDDENADKLASDIIKIFNKEISNHPLYRNCRAKIGVTSLGLNIVYGNNTGATPDGRFKGVPYNTGINPTSNADNKGLLVSLKSIMKIDNNLCPGGLVTTVNVVNQVLGEKRSEKSNNLIGLLDGFFNGKGDFIEINILDKAMLMEAQDNPLKFSKFVIRNGGMLLRFNDLDSQVKESADEIISNEDNTYRRLINTLSLTTLAQLFLTYIVFAGFTHASLIGMILGIILSLGLVIFSFIITILGVRKIRGYRKQYRIYEGREILLNMYNKLSKGLDAELVDVY